jgi:hypothetical protein
MGYGGYGDVGRNFASLGGVFAKPGQVMDEADADAKMSIGSSQKSTGYVLMAGGFALFGAGVAAKNPIVQAGAAFTLAAGAYLAHEWAEKEREGAAQKARGTSGESPKSSGTPTVNVHDLPDAKKGSNGKPDPNAKQDSKNHYPNPDDYYPNPDGPGGGGPNWAGIRDVDAVGAFGAGLSSTFIQVGASTYRLSY